MLTTRLLVHMLGHSLPVACSICKCLQFCKPKPAPKQLALLKACGAMLVCFGVICLVLATASTSMLPSCQSLDCGTAQLRKHFPSWRWQVHEAARIAIQEAWAFNDGEALGKRGPWWKDGRFDKEIAGWYVTGACMLPRSLAAIGSSPRWL